MMTTKTVSLAPNIPSRSSNWKFRIGTILGTLAAALGIYCYVLATGPDFDLHFERDIPTPVPVEKLQVALDDLKRWPEWIHLLQTASFVDEAAATDPRLAVGRKIRLLLDPKRGPWAKFEFTLRLTQYIPGRLLVFEVIDDSTGKLTRHFDRLEWRVELRPGGKTGETVLHGEAFAHTRQWRSRLWGRLADRIFMNQVYFPDLFALSKLGTQSNTTPDYLRQK